MKLVLLSILFVLMMVAAQVSWKNLVQKYPINNLLDINVVFSIVTHYYFWAGVLLYGLATLLYLYMLSHFEFNKVQMIVIPLSLIVSISAAFVIFGESIPLLSLVGLGIIVFGLFLTLLA